MCFMPNLQNKDRHAYKTLNGNVLSLGWLEKKQVEYLEHLKFSADHGADYFALLTLVRGPEALPLKDFDGRVTPEACQSVFFQVAQDIVDRAGIAQGRVVEPDKSLIRVAVSDESRIDVLDPKVDFMSLADAGKLIKLSRAAIHLALTKGKIHGWRVGTIWIVDRRSVLAYGKFR